MTPLNGINNPERWSLALQAQSQALGKSYIVLSANGSVQAMPHIPRGARALKFKQVAAAVQALRDERLNEQLGLFAERTLGKYRGRIFPWKKGSLKVAREILMSRTEAQERFFFHPERMVTNSTSGKDGVYFCTAEGKTVPAKLLTYPQRAIFADRFFMTMGFQTPETQLVPSVPSEAIDSDKRGLHTVKMQYLTSNAWEDTELFVKKQAVAHPEFARQLGRMLLFDVLMGNTDRLAKGSMNAGNFMVDSDNHLVLCDDEIHLDDPDVEARIPQALRELLTDVSVLSDYLTPLVSSAGSLDQGVLVNFRNRVYDGVQEGARDFLELMDNHRKMDEIFDGNSVYIEAFNRLAQVIKQERIL